MKKAFVKFSVGVAHPLFDKFVEAEIISENAGYNRSCVYARTIKPVLWEEDKSGIMVFKNGNFVGYETRAAYSEIWEGYVDEIKK